jgi:gp178|nr:MAG TPA: Protein of unknown function (DUF1642) [Caudoviricetes sp.]
MMNKDEAVQKLATAGRLSIAHAEDLYDSFFPKPVVPQYVADWYEGNKRNLDLNLCGLVYDLAMNSTDCYREEFKPWAEGNKKTFITTLVNMHQFGYEVEKEARYIVKFKGVYGDARYLNHEIDGNWYINSRQETHQFRVAHTRKELEANGFDWVFSCEGVEVKEVE